MYWLLGAGVALGLYALPEDAPAAVPASADDDVQVASTARIASRMTPPPSLPSDDTAELDVDGELAIADDEVRGFTLEDPAEFAMVFSVDGDTYVQLSTEETAETTGRARLVEDGEGAAAIAPVTVDALPEEYRAWAGRTVLVDGTCEAKVIGFAEVSRAAGDASAVAFDHEDDAEAARWTVERLRNANITLAARLDGCDGTWARATTYSPSMIARGIDEPTLENAATADLLADAGDQVQQAWRESGGEGDWRDAVDVTSSAYVHPATNERWIFVSAQVGGSCGEPGVSEMAVYRANADGTVRRFAKLDYAGAMLHQVVDVDGDGQPELVLGEPGDAQLADLANEHHTSIYEPTYYSEGCGC